MVIFATNWLVGEAEVFGDLTLPTENEVTDYSFSVVTWMLSKRAFPKLSHRSFKIPAKARGGVGGQFANKACVAEKLILLFPMAKQYFVTSHSQNGWARIRVHSTFPFTY